MAWDALQATETGGCGCPKEEELCKARAGATVFRASCSGCEGCGASGSAEGRACHRCSRRVLKRTPTGEQSHRELLVLASA